MIVMVRFVVFCDCICNNVLYIYGCMIQVNIYCYENNSVFVFKIGSNKISVRKYNNNLVIFSF